MNFINIQAHVAYRVHRGIYKTIFTIFGINDALVYSVISTTDDLLFTQIGAPPTGFVSESIPQYGQSRVSSAVCVCVCVWGGGSTAILKQVICSDCRLPAKN